MVRMALAVYLNENDIGSVSEEEQNKFDWLKAGNDGILGVLSSGLGGVFPPMKLNKFFNEWEVPDPKPKP